jgi:opacity protein-like surface antigen
MKRTVLGVVTAVLALTAIPQVAQGQTSMAFGIAAGASIPTGDFGDAFGTGFHGMATLGFSPAALPFGLRIDGMYNSLDASEGVDATAKILAFSANGIFSMPGAVASPYLIGGLGFYNTDLDVPGFDSSTDFGINIGLGARFNLSGFGTFAEVRFHNIFTEEDATRFIPLTFGIIF